MWALLFPNNKVAKARREECIKLAVVETSIKVRAATSSGISPLNTDTGGAFLIPITSHPHVHIPASWHPQVLAGGKPEEAAQAMGILSALVEGLDQCRQVRALSIITMSQKGRWRNVIVSGLPYNVLPCCTITLPNTGNTLTLAP